MKLTEESAKALEAIETEEAAWRRRDALRLKKRVRELAAALDGIPFESLLTGLLREGFVPWDRVIADARRAMLDADIDRKYAQSEKLHEQVMGCLSSGGSRQRYEMLSKRQQQLDAEIKALWDQRLGRETEGQAA